MRLTSRHAHRILLYRKLLNLVFERIDFVRLTDEVILEAAQPLPFSVRSLDAIHLATAIDWRRRNQHDLVFATHDDDLATAARRVGFRVLGA